MSAQGLHAPSSPEGLEPVDFETQRLEIFDFDNTLAATFEPKPGGVGVEQAYELAVRDVFGERSHEYYMANGGLLNRAPREVSVDLLGDIVGNTDFEASDDTVDTLTEMLVAAKLGHLVDQIDRTWPRPVPGLAEFWMQLSMDPKANTAIISSGHRKFIEKVFETWALPQADIIISDDEMRRRSDPRHKPDPFGVALAHREWLQMHGQAFNMELVRSSKSRMRYYGDDPCKDGEMAARARIDFELIDPHVGWVQDEESLGIAGSLIVASAREATA